MSQSQPGNFHTSPPTATLLGVPSEVRLKIYKFLFSDIAQRLGNRLVVEYHFCDKTHEITTDADRFRGRGRTTGLTPILRTCKKVHLEAQDLIFDYVTFIATLKHAANPLCLGRGIGHQLGQARILKLRVSIAFPCGKVPQCRREDGPSAAAVATTRPKTWDGEASVGARDPATDGAETPSRARAKTWGDPMASDVCMVTYLRRLVALLDAIEYGRNLKVLEIIFCNSDRSLKSHGMELIMRTIDSRVIVDETCPVLLRLDGHSDALVTDQRVAMMLNRIKG